MRDEISANPAILTEKDKMTAMLQYFLNNVPMASWQKVAGALYRMKEEKALQAAKKFLTVSRGKCCLVVASVLSSCFPACPRVFHARKYRYANTAGFYLNRNSVPAQRKSYRGWLLRAQLLVCEKFRYNLHIEGLAQLCTAKQLSMQKKCGELECV